jgi:PAS domain S-box-containing protein
MEARILELFAKDPDLKAVAAGQVLYPLGKPLDCLYVLVRGEADILMGDVFVEKAGPGTVVGEMALVNPSDFGTTVHCVTECAFAQVERVRFEALNREYPGFCLEVMRLTGRRFRAAARALTDRHAADHEALVKSETQYRELVENVNSIILRWGRDGRVLFMNDYGRRFFGYTDEEIVGRHVVGTIVPESDSTGRDLKPLMDQICSDPRGYEQNVNENMRRNGERVWIAWTNKVVQGLETEVLSVGVDITERRRMDAQREALEERLRATRRLEAIGGLAGGLAHDFNNLLAVIIGAAELAQGRTRDEAMLADLRQVLKASGSALALVRQLLAVGGRQANKPVALDLNKALLDAQETLLRALGQGVTLTLAPAPDLGLARADPGQVEQVLMNLVLNARDAMPKGGKITLETANATCEDAPAGRDCVRLSVRDTGDGMDEATQARIFEPFFTTKGPGKGSGLGLATVYGIVHQSGGAIHVRSRPGKGSVFDVFFPRMHR